MTELWQRTALDLGRLIAAKEVRAVEVLDAVLARVEAVNPTVNAVVTLTADRARAQAEAADAAVARGEVTGPLHGVPVTVKDLTDTAGVRTTYGSTFFADHVPEGDAVLVERLKAAGCVILGKTNTPEFGGKFDTENRLFGATRNPWRLAHSPGGSSGGAAAAVATGMGPIAHGNDGGGSLRVPASCCGVFALKPHFGRVPFWPRFDGWATLNHEGPLARSVRDAAAMLDVMAGPDDRDRLSLPPAPGPFLAACDGDLGGLRIAWSPTLGYGRVDPGVRALCEAAARVFEDLGAHVEEASPGLDKPEFLFTGTALPRLLVQFERDLPEGFAERLDPDLTLFLPFVEGMSLRDAIQCEFGAYAMWDRLAPFFARYDLLLTPVMAAPPHLSGQFGPRTIDGAPIESALEPFFTYPFNLTGQPAASVPAGFTGDGLPVGLQIVGRRFDEATVLRASARYEEARPWAGHWPDLAA
ncbi:amidase [Rhodocaloribacter sp.]